MLFRSIDVRIIDSIYKLAYTGRMSAQDTLKNLGLEDKEIRAYLALLELGEASILAISQKSGLKRPTTYLVIHSLEERGLASRVMRGKKIFFVPQHPQKLVTETELRLKELQEVVPQLESLFHKEEGRPRVMIYEGREALDRAYDEMFVVKGEAVFMSTIKFSMELFPRTFKKFQYITFSEKFRMRELADESEEGKRYANEFRGPYREIRFIPKEFLPFEIDLGIFGNRALITSVKKEFFTVSIESEEIARAFRIIFDIAWQAAKE